MTIRSAAVSLSFPGSGPPETGKRDGSRKARRYVDSACNHLGVREERGRRTSWRRTFRLRTSRSSPSSIPLGVSRIIGRSRNRGIVDQMPKRFQPHLPGPDRRVAIDAAAAFAATIVQVPDAQAIQPDGPVQPVDRFIVLLRRAQGIARRENMAGVRADAQPLGMCRRGRGSPEMLEAVAQAGPLAGGRLQVDHDSQAFGAAVNLDREPARSAQTPASSPWPMCEPGCSTRSAMPSRLAALDLDVIASIDFCHRASSGLARLIR